MKKFLKDSIADIKFSLNRLAGSELAHEQEESLILLQQALKLVQQAEDKAQIVPSYNSQMQYDYGLSDVLGNSDSRFHLN